MLDRHSTIWPTFTNSLSLSCQYYVERLTLHGNYTLIVGQLLIFTHQIRLSVRRILKYFTVHMIRSNLYIVNGMRVFRYKDLPNFDVYNSTMYFSSDRIRIYQLSVIKINFVISRYLNRQFKAIDTWKIFNHSQLNLKLTKWTSIRTAQLVSSFKKQILNGPQIYIKL